jgi:hypothetical protein
MKAIRETLYLIVILSGIITELLHIAFVHHYVISYADTIFSFFYFIGSLIILFFGNKCEFIHYPYWVLMAFIGFIHVIFKWCGVNYQNMILVYMDSGLSIELLVLSAIKYEGLRKE